MFIGYQGSVGEELFCFLKISLSSRPWFLWILFSSKKVCIILTILEVSSVDINATSWVNVAVKSKNLLNMAEIRLTRVEQGQTKIRNVTIAVTPKGFWCCPFPVVFQKTIKTQNPPCHNPRPLSRRKRHQWLKGSQPSYYQDQELFLMFQLIGLHIIKHS